MHSLAGITLLHFQQRREWTVGSMSCPSVEELDKQYGTRWRPEHKERQFYSVRKVIVEELRRRAVAKFKRLTQGTVSTIHQAARPRAVLQLV